MSRGGWVLLSEIFCYADLGLRKDDAAFWRHVVATLGVERERIVVVGDTLEQDVVAPRESGMFSIWFDEGGTRAGDSRGYPVVGRLRDIVPIVRARQV